MLQRAVGSEFSVKIFVCMSLGDCSDLSPIFPACLHGPRGLSPGERECCKGRTEGAGLTLKDSGYKLCSVGALMMMERHGAGKRRCLLTSTDIQWRLIRVGMASPWQ